MIKFDKDILLFYYIIFLLGIFNLSLFYRIQLVLPISGLIVLCLLPGYLICLLLKIKVNDIYENFLYIIGLSIIFDLLFCLLFNMLLPLFGIHDPLSSQNLQIGFSIVLLALTLLIVYSHKGLKISLKFPKILKIEKILLIFAFAIMACILIGIYFVNADFTNLFLIFSIFLIPILLVFLIIYHNNSIKRIYPLILYIISFSLLMLLALRSNYIIGVDTHEEYYFFYSTFLNSIWVPNPNNFLSSAVSISILPTIFEKFLDIDPQLLFKILYPFIFSVTPLIIYVIVKKYFNELLALLASCYFMFQSSFITTTQNSRTSIGIFFVALAILVMCDKEMPNWKKYLLSILFITGTIFSHYTTSFIFLGIISLTYLIGIVFNSYENRKEKTFFNFPFIFFAIGLMFFWYAQVINSVLTAATNYTIFRITIFNDLFQQDVSKYTPTISRYSSFLSQFTRFFQTLIYILIGIGVLFVLYSRLQKKIQRNSFPKFIVNINRDLFFMGLVALGALLCIIFAPSLFFQYDILRTRQLLDIVLPIFLIIGAYNFFILVLRQENLHCSHIKFNKKIVSLKNYCKVNKNQIISGIILFLLIPIFLFQIGVTDQIGMVPYSIIFNSPKISKDIDYGYAYIYIEDANALQWFKNNSDEDSKIFADGYGKRKITSLLNQNSYIHQKSFIDVSEQITTEDYIFLSVTNNYYDIFREPNFTESKIIQFNYILNRKNKMFSNGAVFYK